MTQPRKENSMARNGKFDPGGTQIPPLVPFDSTAQPAIPTATDPQVDRLEKAFSSTPTASDAVAFKPADVAVTGGMSSAPTAQTAVSLLPADLATPALGAPPAIPPPAPHLTD
jgi:hypothetical protein